MGSLKHYMMLTNQLDCGMSARTERKTLASHVQMPLDKAATSPTLALRYQSDARRKHY